MKEILKNNILSVICGVVVVIALVVPVWPMSGYKDKLHAQLNERVSVFNALNTVRTKTRNQPNVNPDPAAQPEPLAGFPNDNDIAKGNEIKTTFETQSKALVDKAIQLNRHGLLVPGTLPIPANNAVAIAFRDKYRAAILPPVFAPMTGGNPAVNPAGMALNMVGGIGQRMGAKVPPTQQDITFAQSELWRIQYAPQLGGTAGNANQGARQQLQNDYNAAAARIPDELRNKTAAECKFYMNPDALPYIQSFNNKEAPSALDIFNAQLQLWVIDDIGAGLLEANGKHNVTQGPVKQLVKLTVPYPMPFVVQPGQTLEGELSGAAPKVTDLGQQNQPSAFPMTTGRISNPLYDVCQFDLVLNVDAESAPRVIQTLSHNRFITIVSASMSVVDSFALQQQGYMFGNRPVVQLTLRCEELFFHSWERPFMPKPMIDLMTGVQPTGGGGEGGPGAVTY